MFTIRPITCWNVQEVINLRDNLYPICGWKGYHELELSTNIDTVGDLWLSLKVNKNKVSFKDIKKEMKKLFNKKYYYSIIEGADYGQPEELTFTICLTNSKGGKA